MPKLTVKKIEAISKPGRYSDGDGLYLNVTNTLSMRWEFRYQFQGKRTWLGLGPYSKSNSLSQARASCLHHRGLIAKGIDPQSNKDEEKRKFQELEQKKKEKALAGKNIVRSVATDWWNDNKVAWTNQKQIQQNINTLRDYVFPKIGDKPIKDVTVEDVRNCLKPIWETKTETASRVRQRLERVFAYAKAKGLRSGENPAQWRNNLDALLPPPASIKRKKALEDPNNGHFGSMAYEEVPAFVQELSKNPSLSARMVYFLILTVARTNSVRMGRWDEIDLKKSQWVIPARNMKNKKPFTIPLSDVAINLLNNLPRVSDYIFPSPADLNKPMSENAMLALVQRRMNRKDVTVHGFRTSFRTWVAEQTNYDGDLAEYALSHEVGSKVEQAYQRSSLVEKRSRMMIDWARFITRCEQ